MTAPRARPATRPKALKRKVFAYVTHQDYLGQRLLIFSHPRAPAAGLQVPAGTVEGGESLEAAVMREAREETGLTDLLLVGFLGEQLRDMADVGRWEVHQRYFFHLRCLGDPPPTWRQVERFGSEARPGVEPPLFEFFWVRLPHEVPELTTDHGYFVPALIERL
ncbi:MAG TPA: NUDIX domain-containing protein [Chloroflexota bacterium]|jgi:8-oxo-dGTP diphosphatase|nr:NUDIX domain-containing protein [Chloroflexota bacterium]